MLLVITQVIILLAGSGFNHPPAPVEDATVTLDDIKIVNDELKEMMQSINEINAEPEIIELENKTAKVKKVPAPVIAEKVESNRKSAKVVTKSVKPAPVKKPAVLVPIVSDSKEEFSVNETKTSVAEVGPDYIKHDSKGYSLADEIEHWTCVHDTVTGLMWEVKSQNDAMRNSNNLYSWYDPEHDILPGKPDGGRCRGDADCDTNAYVQAMNENNYCGHNDWRLPTREQMQTLVNLKNGKDKVKINKQYFPQTVPSWYWTSSDKENNNEFAWYVLFRNGFALSDLKERPKHIRLVRENVAGNNGS